MRSGLRELAAMLAKAPGAAADGEDFALKVERVRKLKPRAAARKKR